jgi:hypothetical protein
MFEKKRVNYEESCDILLHERSMRGKDHLEQAWIFMQGAMDERYQQ